MLAQLSPGLFYDIRHRRLLEVMTAMRTGKAAINIATVARWLRDMKATDECGGSAYVLGHNNVSWGEALNPVLPIWFPDMVSALEDYALRRFGITSGTNIIQLCRDGGQPDTIIEAFRDISDRVTDRLEKREHKPVMIIKPTESIQFNPDNTLCLVGDTDITKGPEGLCVIGGPPGSGKSMAAMGLAIAGAIGDGLWMGRKIHRKFKTLMIQAENGRTRLKKEMEAIKTNHPGLNLDDHIRISLPPEGGLPFGRKDFRDEVKRNARDWEPDLVVIDPWTAISMQDGSSDVIEMLGLIRSCFAGGDKAPALVIVAHTRKPKAEGMRKGRGLLNELCGSMALGGSARCVYVILPFTDDIQDDRVLLCCAKLSNSEFAPADTVWHRKLGTFFPHCTDNPEDFWKDNREPDVKYNYDHLVAVFAKKASDDFWTKTDIAEALAKEFNGGQGVSTAQKYLANQLAVHLEPISTKSKYLKLRPKA